MSLVVVALGVMLAGSSVYAAGVRHSSPSMRVLGATVAVAAFPVFSLIIFVITLNSD